GACVPATHLTRVDFPAPLSPTRAMTSPLRTSKSTSDSACTEPNDFVMLRSWRSGVPSIVARFLPQKPVEAPGRAPPPPRSTYLQYFAYTPTQTSDFFRNFFVKSCL